MQARPTGATRSITAGIPKPPANANASDAYGPDDPAYGPPEPGWSHQDRPAADVHGAEQPGRASRPERPSR